MDEDEDDDDEEDDEAAASGGDDDCWRHMFLVGGISQLQQKLPLC